jgi:hypothetical protein
MWFWYFLTAAAFVCGSFYNFGQNGLDDRFMIVEGFWALTFVVSVGAIWVYASLQEVFAQDKEEATTLRDRVEALEREVEMAGLWKMELTRRGQEHEQKLDELLVMVGEASLGQTEEIVDLLMAGGWGKTASRRFYDTLAYSDERCGEEDEALRKLEDHLGL